MLLLHFVVTVNRSPFPLIQRGVPPIVSEQHILVGYESFHHQSLVSDVVEGCHGVQLGGPHQCRAEDDAQVLAGHEVLLLVLGHPGKRERGKQ